MLMLVGHVMELAALERLAVEDERLLAGRALTVLQEPVLLLHRDRERIQKSWVTGQGRTGADCLHRAGDYHYPTDTIRAAVLSLADRLWSTGTLEVPRFSLQVRCSSS